MKDLTSRLVHSVEEVIALLQVMGVGSDQRSPV